MTDPVQPVLAIDDAVLAERWAGLLAWIAERFGRSNAAIEPILFLIGVQERGAGYQPDLAKEDKQAVIMDGTYHAFETLGFYERVGMESDGAWIWERIVRLPELTVEEQEKLLRVAILRYFEPVLA